MSLVAALLVCITLAPRQVSATWPLVAVRSPDARHAARIEKVSGQERVRDALARWQLVVVRVHESGASEVAWTCAYPYQGRGRFALADGGLVFGAALEPYMPGQPIVRVHCEGVETASVRGSALGLAREALVASTGASSSSNVGAGASATAATGAGGLAWIAPADDALRFAWREDADGPRLALLVRSRDGVDHGIDALDGSSLDLAAPPAEPSVAPLALVEQGVPLEPPYVRAFRVPALVRAGEPCALEVEGALPTPNWYIAGYALEVDAHDARHLVLHPLAAPPKATIQAAVLQGFRGAPVLDGLARGRWTISVVGREQEPLAAQALEVLPARLVARAADGAGALREWYANGVVGEPSAARWRVASAARRATLERLAADLRKRAAITAAQPKPLVLGWWDGERWNEWRGELERAPVDVQALAHELARE